MPWEALTAIGTLLSALIIAVSAVVAIAQIRHLRAAAALQGFLALMTEASGPRIGQANAYIETELPERLKDEAYRRELAEGKFDTEMHPELVIGALWERIGALIHFNYIDESLFIDFVGGICLHQWDLLREVTELRRRQNPMSWERFEELADRCRAYQARRGYDTASSSRRDTIDDAS
jgi:hypothetical protein